MRNIIAMLLLLNVVFGAMAQDTVTFNKTYDFNHGYESGSTVISLDDGYLVCASGYATEFDGWWALKLLRTDLDGNELWRKVYGQERYSFRNSWYGGMVQVDGGYCLAAGILDSGNVDGKGVLYRFDEYGDTLWTRLYDKPGFSYFHSVRQTRDKGYIVVGNQNISGIRHYWLMKIDSMGIAVWDTTLGVGYATTIEITQDGGYIIGGAGGTALSTARIVKTDSIGNIEWVKNHFSGNQQGCYWSAGLASDGGYYIWGCSDTVINPTDFILVPTLAKLNGSGTKIWSNYYNSPNNRIASIYQVKELPNGRIMLTGERGVPIEPIGGGWIVYMENDGSTIWEKVYYSNNDTAIGLGPNLIYDFQALADGGYIFTGDGFTDIDPGPLFNNNQDIWLLKLDSLGNWYAPPDTSTCPPPCDTVGITKTQNLQAKLYPNPTTSTLTIELPQSTQGYSFALYNLLGQQVIQAALTEVQTTLSINQPSGICLYRITATNGQVQTGKVVVE